MTPHDLRVVDLITTATDRKFEPVALVADAIIKLTRKTGSCLPQDLLILGFTKQEIGNLWHLANAMAQVELRLEENAPLFIPLREVRCA